MLFSHLAAAWLYVFMALLFGVMGASLGWDVWKNHYEHRPLRPLILWISLMMGTQALHFIGLAVARFYRYDTGTTWPGLNGLTWVYVHFLMTITVVGFYTAFRHIRARGK